MCTPMLCTCASHSRPTVRPTAQVGSYVSSDSGRVVKTTLSTDLVPICWLHPRQRKIIVHTPADEAHDVEGRADD
jgi:hypothetical protein